MSGDHDPDRPPSRRARVLLWVGLAVVAVLLAIGLWLASRPAHIPLQGEVEADTANVATKALARVDRMLVEEGDRVRAGQVLAVLSSPELANAQRQAQAVLDGARATRALTDQGARSEDVTSLRAAWLAAKAQATLAATSSARADRLYAQGVIAAQRRDEANALRDSSGRTAEAAHAQYAKAIAGVRPEAKAVADAQVRVAEAGAATATALNGETRLLSPIAGEVSRRLVQPGEIVSPVLPAIQIVDIDHPRVLLTLREDNLAGLSEGRVLAGRVPGLDRVVRFRVRHIGAQGEFATVRADRQARGYDVRAFEVTLRPVERVNGLRPGMSVLFDWPQ
ncbi:HlyD family secretion protein [Sphingomonas gellani]|uniref:HlyD family secretion protein n=1 Tax=Sphingomonas gellani TaxID=1166340 RepID=A0A1H8AX77_9SPHN|nr:efflux RND transporter periplasmic adaptor subunit [Sphingomonas gellani]SEM74534.1 HlyD family secretion protein [Sphingomonas gellani]